MNIILNDSIMIPITFQLFVYTSFIVQHLGFVFFYFNNTPMTIFAVRLCLSKIIFYG